MFLTENTNRSILGSELEDSVNAVTESMIYADLVQLPQEEIKEFWI